MKVLFITAYFPPSRFGWGYMRICEQVADGLAEKGHQVAVLTSTYRDGVEVKPYSVHRLLPIDPDWNAEKSATRQFFFGRRKRERRAIQDLLHLVGVFHPQVIFVWHAHGLPRVVLQAAEMLPEVKMVYYFANYLPEMADEYIEYWKSSPKYKPACLLKRPLAWFALKILAREGKPIVLKYEHSISVSDYVRQRLIDQRLIGPDAVVIPNGADLEMFHYERNGKGVDRPLRGLSAGRMAPEKGIHTLLQALSLLRQRGQLRDIHLTLVGDGPGGYKSRLQQIIAEGELEPYVNFDQPVPIGDMPALLALYDVLFLPSEWQEPLANIMLEAMAEGLLVIGTLTGGSGEVLSHLRTGLAFPAGDVDALADLIATIISDRALLERLSKNGQQQVREKFDMKNSINQIESYIQGLIQTAA